LVGLRRVQGREIHDYDGTKIVNVVIGFGLE